MPAFSVRKYSVSHKAEQQISDRHYCWLTARNPSLCVRFRFSFEDGGDEGELGQSRRGEFRNLGPTTSYLCDMACLEIQSHGIWLL